MVIGQVNGHGVPFPPDKADPEPVVDTDAVLSLSIACEFLQPVPRRNPQVTQTFSRVREEQFPVSCPLKFPGKPFIVRYRPAPRRWLESSVQSPEEKADAGTRSCGEIMPVIAPVHRSFTRRWKQSPVRGNPVRPVASKFQERRRAPGKSSPEASKLETCWSAVAPWSEGGRMCLSAIVTSGRDEGVRSDPTDPRPPAL